MSLWKKKVTYCLVITMSVLHLFITEPPAAILDYSGLGPIFTPIPQSYGDIVNLDLSHLSHSGFGSPISIFRLSYWDNGYSDLTDVAWGNQSDPDYVGQITFEPSAGYRTTVDNFDLGFWNNDTYDTQVRIYNEDYSQILYDSGALAAIGGPNAINFNIDVDADETIHLQWKYPSLVAIDNVVYDVNAVPVPSAVWLLGSSLIGLAGLRRKFRNTSP